MTDKQYSDWKDRWRRVKAAERAGRSSMELVGAATVPCRACRHWEPTDDFGRVCAIKGVTTAADDSCEMGERTGPLSLPATAAVREQTEQGEGGEGKGGRLGHNRTFTEPKIIIDLPHVKGDGKTSVIRAETKPTTKEYSNITACCMNDFNHMCFSGDKRNGAWKIKVIKLQWIPDVGHRQRVAGPENCADYSSSADVNKRASQGTSLRVHLKFHRIQTSQRWHKLLPSCRRPWQDPPLKGRRRKSLVDNKWIGPTRSWRDQNGD